MARVGPFEALVYSDAELSACSSNIARAESPSRGSARSDAVVRAEPLEFASSSAPEGPIS
jgi:hypothetical protein